jgi:hypothetical protein
MDLRKEHIRNNNERETKIPSSRMKKNGVPKKVHERAYERKERRKERKTKCLTVATTTCT